MQILDHEKRNKILQAAGELFASRPFHKVLLSDVAATAAVGKGTLYIYFKNKEELYLAVLYDGLERLADHVRQCLDSDETRSPEETLEMVVRDLVDQSFENPHLLELIRSVQVPLEGRVFLDQKRHELTDRIEAVICRGVRIGRFSDPHPGVTARFVPGLIRSVLLDGVAGQDRQVVTEHILRFLFGSLRAEPLSADDEPGGVRLADRLGPLGDPLRVQS
jgi:AcrR family transcriptional regulator